MKSRANKSDMELNGIAKEGGRKFYKTSGFRDSNKGAFVCVTDDEGES